ncbi:MAG: hypothetical protein KZQ66_01565 [Candidatus Thiodiazotropha sp. (ex Lucinoma aequizonata)]|nr:hypothetical protein [Candidatus Thiodiazotropha sp. (ex Lucinoma aequizonata)]MCU7887701.1 hypothetical protein [Candidatus Thiodiazotropha sp. (ex Lucinoma aequizonata)]MCU7895555.1 hypothetical protein [Candidatus Thiodiazotropha sp. (ex Lucinoma aequizonata)]MCU7900249.1 hypothetical protein [Candidatus Thiodiazotropha sp. (ex Lucinoma aequizonata)]MCU7900860.1 hypothetical protein [Candidatus Thiodiazotropha sp. (ex Lucinoma aequizonata)]
MDLKVSFGGDFTTDDTNSGNIGVVPVFDVDAMTPVQVNKNTNIDRMADSRFDFIIINNGARI